MLDTMIAADRSAHCTLNGNSTIGKNGCLAGIHAQPIVLQDMFGVCSYDSSLIRHWHSHYLLLGASVGLQAA